MYSAGHSMEITLQCSQHWITANVGMAHSDCGLTCGCSGKTVKSLENTYVPYLSASAVVIHYEEALYQVYVIVYIYLLPSLLHLN